MASRIIVPFGLVLLAALASPAWGDGETPGTPTWQETKCIRYKAAWSEALTRFGKGGLGADFLRRHEAFLASGCLGEHDVCPRSGAELDLANVMVIQAMNAGTASTFPPFGCR